ncbi:ubiquinol oxidase subunit II [Ideonella sp. DXS22W]|uniref:Ubiquinol oxidase polypeptide II n=1 Tax=Pseudaquabacterium inlustre TaxID=2984192 RepID=A0ABU9CER4_9BURK
MSDLRAHTPTPRHRGRALLPLAALLPVLPLAGCKTIVMNPAGDIARQQADLIVTSTVLMLLIIVPVIALTLLFAWRYRVRQAGASSARYEPDWDHSTKLELLIWGAPLAIIIALGTITWISTHQLDPFRPLSRLDENRALPANVKPLEVQAVALDWKWLFVYPELGIATVNELALPVDRPVRFTLTASTVMNSFYVPALAGQIYAMPGMASQLNAVINKPGTWEGFSANYSGEGFSGMRFAFHGLAQADFDRWVEGARGAGAALDRATYLALEKPSQRDAVRRFASVDKGLFDAVVNRCVEPGRMCMADMMAIDARGGAGKGGLAAVTRANWRDGQQTVVAGLCTAADPEGRGPVAVSAAPAAKAARSLPANNTNNNATEL